MNPSRLPFRFVIQLCIAFVVTATTIRAVKPVEPLPSLDKEPYINPKIVEALTSWVSDGGDQIVAIDIDRAQDSNRFCCPPDGQADWGKTTSFSDEKENRTTAFGYKQIGRTHSGVHVVKTWDSSDGSAAWISLVFLVIENDYGLTIEESDSKATRTRPRRLLKKLGDVFLGDRWQGQLKVEGNKVHIGKDHNWRAGGDDLDWEEIVKLTNDWERVIEVDFPGPFLFPENPLSNKASP